MDAETEPLGRGTAKAVEKPVMIPKSGRRNTGTAFKTGRIVSDTDISRCTIAGNIIENESDREFLSGNLPDFTYTELLSYDRNIIRQDRTRDNQETQHKACLIKEKIK